MSFGHRKACLAIDHFAGDLLRLPIVRAFSVMKGQQDLHLQTVFLVVLLGYPTLQLQIVGSSDLQGFPIRRHRFWLTNLETASCPLVTKNLS